MEEGLVSVFQLIESCNRLIAAKAELIRVRLQIELMMKLEKYYRQGTFITAKRNIIMDTLIERKPGINRKYIYIIGGMVSAMAVVLFYLQEQRFFHDRRQRKPDNSPCESRIQ